MSLFLDPYRTHMPQQINRPCLGVLFWKIQTIQKDMRYIFLPRSTSMTSSSVGYLFRSQIN
ncbi:hypothetical protein F383_33802 [Gossypium arboreum]|uniref:Uncharacterized protein n=1 Tax=Gossypium arboreum TaxID=29729 RepID=A0A0B0N4E6_GOSAR|nr:hypothetical protein F383_33802 [Gossypium arboreum]